MPSDGSAQADAAAPRPRTLKLRTLWLKLHRWFGLSGGLVLALVGTLGAFLIVAQPIDKRLNPQLFRTQPAYAAAHATPHDVPGALLETLRRRLQAEFGPTVNIRFRPPRADGETLWARISGPWDGTVFLHPASGTEQGRRAETESVVNWVFRLHSQLLLQDIGKAVLAIAAASYVLLLVTGVVLWWPKRWRIAFRIERRAGTLRLMFDLHRVVGATLGLWILVSVATGAYMAWRPIGGWITAALGATPTATPGLPKVAPPRPAGGPPTLDALVATAQRALPDGSVGFVQVPAGVKPVRVRLRASGEPHPNGVSAVVLDPRDGRVLAVQRWDSTDPGARLVAWVYPLHTGELGGPALEALNMAGGLSLGLLGGAGAWLWWRRRQVRRGAAVARRGVLT